MMKGKGFFIFAVVVALVVGLAIYDFQKEKSDERAKEESSKIVTIPAKEVTKVTISKGAERFVVQSEKGEWQLVEPVKDLADQKVIQEFIEGIVTEKLSEIAVEGNNIDWKAFGLDSPKAKIELEGASNLKMTIQISSRKNFQGESFLRLNDQNKVLIASSTWFTKVEKQLIDLRDKRLLKEPTAAIVGFQVKLEGEQYQISLADSQWSFVGKEKFSLGQNKVREMITMFGEMSASSVLTEVSPTAQQVKEWGLQAEVRSVSFNLKDNKTSQVKFYLNKAKEWFAVRKDDPKVYKVDPSLMERFARFSIDALRDREEPFRFTKNDVRKIEIKTALKVSSFVKKGEVWELEPADPKLEVIQEEVKNLVDKSRNLTVATFTLKKSDPKAFKPENVLLLKDGEGKAVLEFSWATAIKEKLDGVEKNVYLAKTNLFADTFKVEESAIENLALTKLTKEKESKKSDSLESKK